MAAWLQQLVDLFSALLTPTIAIVATYIAIEQYRLTKLKTRFELYERRSAVYRATIEFIRAITRERCIGDAAMHRFVSETAEANFLFKSEIWQYIEVLYKRALELEASARRGGGADGQLLAWFEGQYEVTRLKFKRYLDLGM